MIPAFTRVARLPTGTPDQPSEALQVPAKQRSSLSSVVIGMTDFSERLGRYLLLAAMVTLLVRPADLFPVLDNAPIYETLIVSCLVVSLRGVARRVSPAMLRANAVALLSMALVGAVILSHLWQFNTYDARLGGIEMLKAFIVFVLVIELIDTPSKMRGLLTISASSVCAVAVLAILHYHRLIQLPALASVEQRYAESGEAGVLLRLCGVGIFNDPNDFALVLVLAIVVCASGFSDRRNGMQRALLIVPIMVLGYALFLTHSRGGFLSAIAAAITFLLGKMGWKRAVPAAMLLVPTLLLLMSHRQTSVNIDDPGDTFQTRLGLWSDALDVFRSSPLTGIGQGKLVDTIGQVAHNSFLQAFAELGVIGGAAFLGMFYFPARGVWRARSESQDLRLLRPCVLAILVGYAVGLLSLSRCYTVPTQLIVAMATAFLLMASRAGGASMPKWGWSTAARVVGASGAFLIVTYLFVRLMIHRGGA